MKTVRNAAFEPRRPRPSPQNGQIWSGLWNEKMKKVSGNHALSILHFRFIDICLICCWSLFVFLLLTLPAAYCLQIVSLRNSYLCMKREYRYQIFGHSNYWSSHSWTIGINNATARFKKDPLTHEQSRWTHCTKNTAALGNTAAARFQKCPLVHEQSG